MAGASGRALVRAGNGPVARGGLQAMGWASVYWGGEPTARHRTIIVIVVSDAGARSGSPLVAGEKTARRVGSHRKGGSSGCAFTCAGNEPVARGGLQAMGWASVYWGGEPTARHRTIIVIVGSDAGARSGAPLVAGEKTARRVGSPRKGGPSGSALPRFRHE